MANTWKRFQGFDRYGECSARRNTERSNANSCTRAKCELIRGRGKIRGIRGAADSTSTHVKISERVKISDSNSRVSFCLFPMFRWILIIFIERFL